ncbi:MAG: hypothetical protein ACKVOQ_14045 [Cyclobacteriaceae bacterium]
MNEISKIEDCFKSINEIIFGISLIKGSHSWISISIDDNKAMDEVLKGYKLLYDRFIGSKLVFIIYHKESSVDVSIVDEKSTEMIDITQLRYDSEQMNLFFDKIAKSEKIYLRLEYSGVHILPSSQRLIEISYVRMSEP